MKRIVLFFLISMFLVGCSTVTKDSATNDLDKLIESGHYSEAGKLIEKNDLLNKKNEKPTYNYKSVIAFNKWKKLYDKKEYQIVLSQKLYKPIKDKFLEKDVLKIVNGSFDGLVKQGNMYTAKRYYDLADSEIKDNLNKETKDRIVNFSSNFDKSISQQKTMSADEVAITEYLGYFKIGSYETVIEKTTLRTDNIGENFFNLSTAYNNYYNNQDILYISGQESLPETFLNSITNPLPEVTGYITKLKQEIENKKSVSKGEYGVSIGMTKDTVLNSSWGKPQDINTTITAYGTHEQWVYGGGNYLYFEDGILRSIQN